jgi:thymidylate synthase ThyX
MISAEVVCDSLSVHGPRLTTFRLRYPKFLHGELMTHRVLSRNASSSRAVPTERLLVEVRDDGLRATFVWWGADQRGMQALSELSDAKDGLNENLMTREQHEPHDTGWGDTSFVETSPRERQMIYWRKAALDAAKWAELSERNGAHKQLVNRMLEPYSHINVLATATEWDNFFGLRLHRDAQPEMRELAVRMWEARRSSEPRLIGPGSWHLPFVTMGDPGVDEDAEPVRAHAAERGVETLEVCKMVSVARCARVSYEDFTTGKRSTVANDVKLYDRLLAGLSDPAQPLHASPTEHQATPDEQFTWNAPTRKRHGGLWETEKRVDWRNRREHGNLVGWRQLRKMLPGEAVAPLPEGYR